MVLVVNLFDFLANDGRLDNRLDGQFRFDAGRRRRCRLCRRRRGGDLVVAGVRRGKETDGNRNAGVKVQIGDDGGEKGSLLEREGSFSALAGDGGGEGGGGGKRMKMMMLKMKMKDERLKFGKRMGKGEGGRDGRRRNL